MKGNADEEAIACSHTNTYAITQVDSSNTTLLLPDFMKKLKVRIAVEKISIESLN